MAGEVAHAAHKRAGQRSLCLSVLGCTLADDPCSIQITGSQVIR